MNWHEFTSTAIRRDSIDVIEWDLRPIGARQNEALDFFLDAVQEHDPFGKSFVLKTDASVILSDSARAAIAKLQEKRISVTVLSQR
jgi:hypothetical protein